MSRSACQGRSVPRNEAEGDAFPRRTELRARPDLRATEEARAWENRPMSRRSNAAHELANPLVDRLRVPVKRALRTTRVASSLRRCRARWRRRLGASEKRSAGCSNGGRWWSPQKARAACCIPASVASSTTARAITSSVSASVARWAASSTAGLGTGDVPAQAGHRAGVARRSGAGGAGEGARQGVADAAIPATAGRRDCGHPLHRPIETLLIRSGLCHRRNGSNAQNTVQIQ